METRQFIVVMMVVLCSFPLVAQQEEHTHKYYFEVRPIPFLLNGYSLTAHYATDDRSQLGFSVFGSTLSEGVNDLVWDIEGEIDLEARQDIALGLSYRYFLSRKKGHKNWYAGVAIGYENYTLTNENFGDSFDWNFYFAAPRIGFFWYPFKTNLFLSTEAVLVIPLIKDDDVTFNSGASVTINGIIPAPVIGIGFRF
ncbi:MAG: hypothetical protein AAFZ89_14110 [Bacteroidota bacterium]